MSQAAFPAAYYQPGTDIGLSYNQQKAALHQLLRQSGPRDVLFVILPKLVRFCDITPQMLVRVSPYDLAASFGPGVSLKRVVLQLTDHPVTPPPNIWPQWSTIKHQNTVLREYDND